MEKIVYTVNEAAQVLGLSRPKMYELIHAEGFPVVRLGERKHVIPVEGLKRWLDNGGFAGGK